MEQHFNKDPELWELAKKRAAFKSHLLSYVLVNAFFWGIWFFNGQHVSRTGLPWPVFPLIGWGIGLLSHFLSVYAFQGFSLIDQEYEKLLEERKR